MESLFGDHFCKDGRQILTDEDLYLMAPSNRRPGLIWPEPIRGRAGLAILLI